jgi:glycosyltransferase
MISTLAHPCTFISTDLYKKLGGFREQLRITADYEFLLRAVLVERATYIHIPRVIAVFNTEGVSSDPSSEKQQLAERKTSWELNFSKPVIEAFENYTQLVRSSELKIGRLVKKFIKPF